MSAQSETRRLTAPDIRARNGGEPIVMLTSYHAHTARLVDQHADVILVGDSLGMVMHGMESTVPVTLPEKFKTSAGSDGPSFLGASLAGSFPVSFEGSAFLSPPAAGASWAFITIGGAQQKRIAARWKRFMGMGGAG